METKVNLFSPRLEVEEKQISTRQTYSIHFFESYPIAWDHEGIDHWKMEPFNEGDMKTHLQEESSFATLFPKYREKYSL